MDVWKYAKWIFADTNQDVVNRYFEYKTKIEIEEICDTKFYISAYTEYAVYINGQFVECGQYDDYEDMKFYDVFSITEYLHKGFNELEVHQYVCGTDFSTRRKQIPGIIFAVVAEDKTLCVSDETCFVRENAHYETEPEIVTPQLSYNFEYDARVKELAFKSCKIVEKTKTLLERPIKKLSVAKEVSGDLCTQGVFLEWNAEAMKSKRSQHAYFSNLNRKDMVSDLDGGGIEWKVPPGYQHDGAYFIYDMGGEIAGLLDFFIDVPKDCEILLSFGEHLDDLRVRSSIGPRNFTFRYYAKAGQNRFFYPFQRWGLRYLQVMIYESSGTIFHMGVRSTNYPLKYKKIPVQDALQRLIWETGRRTLSLCMHEHYEDCPWREQAQYAMDSRVQILCGYYAFDEYDFPKATLKLMAHSLREDKLLELCAPGRVPVNIPCFTAVFVREVMEYVEYSRDYEFAKELLPVLRSIVEGFLCRITQSGLVGQFEEQWNFYEWKPRLNGFDTPEGTEYDCLLNAFVSDAFQCYAKINEPIDLEESKKYYEVSKQLNKAMHDAFWRPEHLGYATYLQEKEPSHELTQSMMMFCNAVPGQWKKEVINTIKSKKLIPCSLSMTIYTYEVLLQYSKDNYAYVEADMESIWSKMLCTNTDTFWETDEGADAFSYAGSLCHGWSAVPIYIWGKYGRNRREM